MAAASQPKGVSQRELARRLGLSAPYVNRLVKAGVVKVGPDGIDPVAAKRAIDASKSVKHSHMDAINAAQRAKHRPGVSPPPAPPPDPPDEGDGDGMPEPGAAPASRRQYDRARAVRESFEASLRRLEFQRRSGRLVEIEVAERVLFDKAREARDAWLNWPAKTAPLLAAELGIDDVERVMRFLTEHVHKQVAALGESNAADFSVEG